MAGYRTVDTSHVRSLRSRALISPRAARRGGFEGIAGQSEYAERPVDYRAEAGSTSRDGQRLRRDESDRRNRGSVPADHNNDDAFQSGGRPSKSGGAGRERQEDAQHINKAANRKQFPAKMADDGRHWLNAYSRGVSGSNGNGDPDNWYSAGNGRRWG